MIGDEGFLSNFFNCGEEEAHATEDHGVVEDEVCSFDLDEVAVLQDEAIDNVQDGANQSKLPPITDDKGSDAEYGEIMRN